MHRAGCFQGVPLNVNTLKIAAHYFRSNIILQNDFSFVFKIKLFMSAVMVGLRVFLSCHAVVITCSICVRCLRDLDNINARRTNDPKRNVQMNKPTF